MAHRRFGKSVFCINEIIDKALRNPHRNPQYAYVGVTYGATKRIAWDYAKQFTAKIPGVSTHEGDLRIEIPRPWLGDKIKILFLGAENDSSIRGIYLDGVVMDEFAEMNPEIWQFVIRATLADRRGWAIFISTPRSQNHFFDLYQMAHGQKDWFRVIYKASETKILPESELNDARTAMDEAAYAQEFECSFNAALIGAYYAKQIDVARSENRITSVPYDHNGLTYTGWDLGIGDATSVWIFQTVGKEIRFVRYTETTGDNLADIVQELKETGYRFHEHFLPHDAEARELQTGKSRIQFIREQKLPGRLVVVPRHNLDDGIHAVRQAFSRCWFDQALCASGINALMQYTRKWDAKQKVFSLKPLHNWASHAADAIRSAIMGLRDDQPVMTEKLPRIADHKYDIFRMEAE